MNSKMNKILGLILVLTFISSISLSIAITSASAVNYQQDEHKQVAILCDGECDDDGLPPPPPPPPPTDTTPPVVSIVSPTGTVAGTVIVEATITDNIGVTNADYRIDSGPWVALAGSGSSWTASLDTTSLPDGLHSIEVRGSDAALNTGFDTGSFSVDNTAPPPPPPPPSSQEIPWGISRINAIDAANLVDESGIDVAIVDTGLDVSHEDLTNKFVWGFSFYLGNSPTSQVCTIANPTPCADGHGHGTHVAGTIAAQDNLLGVIGVAPQVDLYVFKGLSDSGSGSYSAIAQSIIKATNGPDGILGTADDAEVISMSLGGPSGTAELQNAVNYALSNNVVIVAATGNDYASSPSYPAAYPGVIKVGAVDSSNAIAPFSNRGETILAPGVSVLSTLPANTYAAWSGTSMATPHVAGVVALAWAAHPTFTGTQIRNLVEASGDVYGIVNALAVV